MSCFAKKLAELIFPVNTFSSQSPHQRKRLFEDIYCYDNIKRLFGMTLESIHPSSILLSGSPASSAKTLFLQCLMRLNGSYFIDCSNANLRRPLPIILASNTENDRFFQIH